MKKITDIDIRNKKVILRCDLNVNISDNKIINEERIIASLETINYLIKQNAKVIIMSHLGKIKEEADKEENSLYIVYKRLEELLATKVTFSNVTKGAELEKKIDNLNPGEVLLMENTRFEDLNDKSESNNNDNLAKYWASLGEVFINDAFGMTHRKHASNSGISKYLESGVGFLIERELEGLKSLIEPERPFTVIMGGAKVGDKITLIANLLKKGDYLLLGGGIANTFLSVNHNVGNSLVSPESIEEVKKLIKEYKDKIILPIDVVVQSGEEVLIKELADIKEDNKIYDIGPKTIELYKKYIDLAKTVFINGTVGLYENSEFAQGTKSILEICSKCRGRVILGGGDALASATKFKINNFYFMSTGGGATLDYIGTEKLACLED